MKNDPLHMTLEVTAEKFQSQSCSAKMDDKGKVISSTLLLLSFSRSSRRHRIHTLTSPNTTTACISVSKFHNISPLLFSSFESDTCYCCCSPLLLSNASAAMLLQHPYNPSPGERSLINWHGYTVCKNLTEHLSNTLNNGFRP